MDRGNIVPFRRISKLCMKLKSHKWREHSYTENGMDGTCNTNGKEDEICAGYTLVLLRATARSLVITVLRVSATCFRNNQGV